MKRSLTDVRFLIHAASKNWYCCDTRHSRRSPVFAGDVFVTEGEMQLAEQPAGISNEKSHLLMSSLDFRGMRLCDGGGTLSANDWRAHAARQNKSGSVWLKHIWRAIKEVVTGSAEHFIFLFDTHVLGGGRRNVLTPAPSSPLLWEDKPSAAPTSPFIQILFTDDFDVLASWMKRLVVIS